MFKGTISEFATALGAEYQEAAGLYRYFRQRGVAKDVGSRPSPSGRGKPSTIFTCPLTLTIELVSEEEQAMVG